LAAAQYKQAGQGDSVAEISVAVLICLARSPYTERHHHRVRVERSGGMATWVMRVPNHQAEMDGPGPARVVDHRRICLTVKIPEFFKSQETRTQPQRLGRQSAAVGSNRKGCSVLGLSMNFHRRSRPSNAGEEQGGAQKALVRVGLAEGNGDILVDKKSL